MKTMKELEILLNKLIELGWKPWKWWYNYIEVEVLKWKIYIKYCRMNYNDNVYAIRYSLRDLVSLESWLWQFLCWLDKNYLPLCSKCNIRLESNNDKIKSDVRYEEEVNYRLMLSSIQEDITKFLLDNIKI